MQLSDTALDELQALYREEFGEDLSPDAAAEIGTRLLDLYALLLRRLP